MAQRLNLETVAEGIETQDQFHFLKRNGCTVGQGYFFSPPVAADRLTELFPGDNNSRATFGDTTRIRLLQGVGR